MNNGDDDDGGFIGYVPTTTDPGYALLIATIVFTFLSNAMIPCLVSLGRKYEKKRIALELAEQQEDEVTSSHNSDNDDDQKQPFVSDDGEDSGIEVTKLPGAMPRNKAKSYMPDSYVRNPAAPLSWTHLLDGILIPPYPGEGSIVGGGSILSGAPSKNAKHRAAAVAHNEDARSSMLHSAASSAHSAVSNASSVWESSILDAGPRSRYGGVRRQRRALQDKALRKQCLQAEREADQKSNSTLLLFHEKHQQQQHPTTAASDLVMGVTSSDTQSRVSARGGRASVVSSATTVRKRGHSPVHSILSKLDDHVISPQDAADAHDPGFYILPPQMEGDVEVDFCCGEYAWWKPAVIGAGFDRIVGLAEWDHEMKRIVQLCVPYSITALLEGIVETIIVALVAQYLGTEAVAAFTIVHLILGLTSEFLGGILGTEATLCSHAIGVGNHKLAGQYVQVSTFLYTVFSIPNIALWSFLVDDVIMLFGFSHSTALIGQEYARVLVFKDWLSGINFGYHGLLNVIGYENFSTAIGVVEGLFTLGATAALVTTRSHTTLQELGLVHLAVSVIFFLFTVWFTICKGWMSKYLTGLVGTIGILNVQTLQNVVRTAVPLSFGYLLEYGEWEVLTIFAAFLGPAEVAAWGILGFLWETFETLSKGIADGGEVRCAYHLGNANPGMAQISAYKSILLSVAASLFFTSFVWIMGEDLAVWFTPDPTLQHLIADLLPLLGVGNIALTAGAVSWALVGAQTRYRLATLVALISSWGITMPLAAIFTYGFRFSLQGITASVVIGYSVTCTILFYILLRSDWDRLSKLVVEMNEESDDDDESSIDPAVARAEQEEDD